MISLEEIRLYLPKYLSPEATEELFDGLRGFPENIYERLYGSVPGGAETIFQGDALRDLLVVNLPDKTIGQAACMILSNTCDIDTRNSRPFHSSLCYSPIFSLEKYRELLKRSEGWEEARIEQHLASLRAQRVTQAFYLPVGAGLSYESIVFLDRICHCGNKSIDRSTIAPRRIFTLSNYGAYLFILKLSIHFTRMNDKVSRTTSFPVDY